MGRCLLHLGRGGSNSSTQREVGWEKVRGGLLVEMVEGEADRPLLHWDPTDGRSEKVIGIMGGEDWGVVEDAGDMWLVGSRGGCGGKGVGGVLGDAGGGLVRGEMPLGVWKRLRLGHLVGRGRDRLSSGGRQAGMLGGGPAARGDVVVVGAVILVPLGNYIGKGDGLDITGGGGMGSGIGVRYFLLHLGHERVGLDGRVQTCPATGAGGGCIKASRMFSNLAPTTLPSSSLTSRRPALPGISAPHVPCLPFMSTRWSPCSSTRLPARAAGVAGMAAGVAAGMTAGMAERVAAEVAAGVAAGCVAVKARGELMLEVWVDRPSFSISRL